MTRIHSLFFHFKLFEKYLLLKDIFGQILYNSYTTFYLFIYLFYISRFVLYNAVVTIQGNRRTQLDQCYNSLISITKSYMYMFQASIVQHQGTLQVLRIIFREYCIKYMYIPPWRILVVLNTRYQHTGRSLYATGDGRVRHEMCTYMQDLVVNIMVL